MNHLGLWPALATIGEPPRNCRMNLFFVLGTHLDPTMEPYTLDPTASLGGGITLAQARLLTIVNSGCHVPLALPGPAR